MGLEATVFLSGSRVSAEWLDDSVRVDATTGAIYSEKHHIPAKAREACSYRLGNARHLAHCREEIERAVKGRSAGAPILTGQVLSEEREDSASLAIRDVAGLKREIIFLGQIPKLSADVRELLFRLSKLVEAAETNRNPIVLS